MEIVAVLALLALFTHEHLFWIAALVLAFVRFPDLSIPIASMAESLQGVPPDGSCMANAYTDNYHDITSGNLA